MVLGLRWMMEFKVGDRFFDVRNGNRYQINKVTDNYVLWMSWWKEKWVYNGVPVRRSALELDIKEMNIVPDTPAARALYAKKI